MGTSRFHNDRDELVQQAIDGHLRTTPGLARLDGYPGTKVVVRTDADPAAVAILSGGGSGHEPAHVGYVGEGMLTAAVAGELFASPAVDAVETAIAHVANEAGCVLVVKDYTGDRLNFGLAAQRARADGHEIRVVTVADDIALPDAEHPRGLAGTVLVHKLAGHLAREGADVDTIAEAAQALADDCRTIGLALTTATMPTAGEEGRFDDDVAEVGLGIHGEPGVERIPTGHAADYAELLADRLLDGAPDGPLIVLINDLGAVPPVELGVLVDALLAGPLGERAELVVGPGRFMTSLDMYGVSVTIAPLDDQRRAALTSPVEPAAWSNPVPVRSPEVLELPTREAGEAVEPSDHPGRRAALQAVAGRLAAARDELDTLDSAVGDGDTGTTFAAGGRAIAESLDELPLADLPALLGALSARVTGAMGGSAGALVGLLLDGMRGALADGEEPPAALAAGLEAMQEHGGAAEGDRTMLDALWPAQRVLADGGDLEEAADVARKAAQATAEIDETGAGRSSYVGADALAGNPDPGAIVAAHVLEAFAAAVCGGTDG
ncbi:MAG: dihydroxyacetone kinase subunit DhaK [Actinomycetota bacterium]